jgi:hypothetical protein
MVMRRATQDEFARWDELVAANPDGGNALQTLAWGDFKSRWGWQPERFVYELSDGRLVVAQWLRRKVLGQGDIWYCPKGPGVTAPEDYLEVVRMTREAGLLGGVFARFESEVLADEADAGGLAAAGLVRANRDPGMKATIFVDLSGGAEAVLASFNQSARRNIRKAEAGGVVVEPVDATDDNLETMFELMKATEARAKYGLRPRYFWIVAVVQYFLARTRSASLCGGGFLWRLTEPNVSDAVDDARSWSAVRSNEPNRRWHGSKDGCIRLNYRRYGLWLL